MGMNRGKGIRVLVVLSLVVSLWLGGCRPQVATTPAPTAAPTDTATPTAPPPTPVPQASPSPTPTLTPTVTPTSTPRPTPTLPPGGVGQTDALQDGLYCATGRPALFLLEPTTDLYHASIERVRTGEVCFFRVRIQYSEDLTGKPFRGGVEFYHPEEPVLNPPSETWYFDNVAYISFNFRKDGPRDRIELWVDRVQNNRWVRISVPEYRAYLANGVLVLEIPCDAVRAGSTWMVAATNPQLNKCDALGVQDDRAALPLP